MITALVILIILQVLGTVAQIALIDKPRQPITRNQAIVSVIVSALVVSVYISIIYTLDGLNG